MINLIPIEKRKSMQKAFYVRFAVVFLVALAFAFLVATAAILPAYFSATVKYSIAKDILAVERKDVLSPEEVRVTEAVDALKQKLSLIETSPKESYIVSEQVIRNVILRKTDDIKIREISYQSPAIGEKTVKLRGHAGSRESLTLFRAALERDPNWSKVDLPVSNFVRGSDIDFSLTLTSAPQ